MLLLLIGCSSCRTLKRRLSHVAPTTTSDVEASIVAHRQFVKTALRINYLPSWGIQRWENERLKVLDSNDATVA